jgi:hypothetical protein
MPFRVGIGYALPTSAAYRQTLRNKFTATRRALSRPRGAFLAMKPLSWKQKVLSWNEIILGSFEMTKLHPPRSPLLNHYKVEKQHNVCVVDTRRLFVW